MVLRGDCEEIERLMLGEERRRFIRLNAHCLLKYKAAGKEEIPLSFIRNISAAGALFYAKEALPLGSALELKINFLPQGQPITVASKVIRTKPLTKVEGFEVAVEFINIRDREREVINQKVSEIYQNSQDRLLKKLPLSFLVLGFITGLLGFLVRFFYFNLGVSPDGWVSITSMLLLFSINLSLLEITEQ